MTALHLGNALLTLGLNDLIVPFKFPRIMIEIGIQGFVLKVTMPCKLCWNSSVLWNLGSSQKLYEASAGRNGEMAAALVKG